MKYLIPVEKEITFATELQKLVKYAFKKAKEHGDCDIPITFGKKFKDYYFRVSYFDGQYFSYINLKNTYLHNDRTENQVYQILSNEFMLYLK